MGSTVAKMFGGSITKTGLQDSSGQTQYYPSTSDAMDAANQKLQKVPPPSYSVKAGTPTLSDAPSVTAPLTASSDSTDANNVSPKVDSTAAAPDVGPPSLAQSLRDRMAANPAPQMTANDTVIADVPSPKLPTLTQPTAQDVATGKAPLAALSTKGKILSALLSAGEGALAGGGQRTAAEGFAAGQQGALRNIEIRNAPALQALNRQYIGSEIGRNQSETTLNAGKASALGPTNAARLAAQGLRINPLTNKIENIPYEELPPALKIKADSEASLEGYRNAGQELRQAQAELDRFRSNPESPQYKLAQQRVNIAAQNAQTAAGRLGLNKQQVEADLFGTVGGQAIPGAPTDAKGKPIGLKTAKTTNAAQTSIEGRAAQLSGKFMSANANDPDKAIAALNGYVKATSDPAEAAAAARASKLIEQQKASQIRSGRKSPIQAILEANGVTGYSPQAPTTSH